MYTMKHYRISKYDPSNRDENGRYMADDWISVSDIGSWYDGVKLEEEEYLRVESAYVQTVNIIMEEHQISDMIISMLAKHDDTEMNVANDPVPFGENAFKFNKIYEGAKVGFNYIGYIVQLCLREFIACILYSREKHFLISFAYDYYLHIICEDVSEDAKNKIANLGIFIEEFPTSRYDVV